MNWEEAIEEMKKGHLVRRKSQMAMIPSKMPDDYDGAPVFETGEEGCRLAAAWSVENKPVHVFQGYSSKSLFIPEDHHTSAIDWIVVTPNRA